MKLETQVLSLFSRRILETRFFDLGQIDAQSYCVHLLLFDGAQNVEFHRLDSYIWRLETLQKAQIIQIQIQKLSQSGQPVSQSVSQAAVARPHRRGT